VNRKNKNRGFKQLDVWSNAVDLFVLLNKMLRGLPYEFAKSKSNTLDACHSISRNIAEGYCRRSLKEYLQYLNIALGSCGELNSSMIVFHKAGVITDDEFELFDLLHFKTENQLLKLAGALQNKLKNGENWDESYDK
jgi:four helix bundle protein